MIFIYSNQIRYSLWGRFIMSINTFVCASVQEFAYTCISKFEMIESFASTAWNGWTTLETTKKLIWKICLCTPRLVLWAFPSSVGVNYNKSFFASLCLINNHLHLKLYTEIQRNQSKSCLHSKHLYRKHGKGYDTLLLAQFLVFLWFEWFSGFDKL